MRESEVNSARGANGMRPARGRIHMGSERHCRSRRRARLADRTTRGRTVATRAVSYISTDRPRDRARHRSYGALGSGDRGTALRDEARRRRRPVPNGHLRRTSREPVPTRTLRGNQCRDRSSSDRRSIARYQPARRRHQPSVVSRWCTAHAVRDRFCLESSWVVARRPPCWARSELRTGSNCSAVLHGRPRHTG